MALVVVESHSAFIAFPALRSHFLQIMFCSPTPPTSNSNNVGNGSSLGFKLTPAKTMAQLTQLTRLERLAALSLERQEEDVVSAAEPPEGVKDESPRAGDKRRSVS